MMCSSIANPVLSPEKSTNVRASNLPAAVIGALAHRLRLSSRSERAARDFLTPVRNVPPPMLPEPAGMSVPLDVPEWPSHLNVRSWGQGPAVLLMHGWGGNLYDLGAFVAPLLERGFRAVAVDAPAHGRSAGEMSSLPDMARAVAAVARTAGPLAGAVGHSMGAAALMLALEAGVQADRVVLIGIPQDPLDHIRYYANRHRLDARTVWEMRNRIAELTGRDPAGINLAATAARLRTPALFIHSADDRLAPVSEALHRAAAWKGARVHLMEGVGHRAILRDPETVHETVGFLAEGRSAQGRSLNTTP